LNSPGQRPGITSNKFLARDLDGRAFVNYLARQHRRPVGAILRAALECTAFDANSFAIPLNPLYHAAPMSGPT